MSDEYKLMIMLEVEYIKTHGYKVGELETQMKLFPYEWYKGEHYVLKIEILTEAIENKKLIIETEKYKELVERVQVW